MKYLIIDGMNFLHRSRGGFQKGPHPLMFNFFRGLRAQVEQHSPDRVYFVLEGHPEHRHGAFADYKGNRRVLATDPDFERKVKEKEQLLERFADVVKLLVGCFPVTVTRHPRFECDDVMHNLALSFLDEDASPDDEVVLVSTDSDFIQTIQKDSRVRLYNPVSKEFVQAPRYDYVLWKSLRGDGSDNIPCVPGFSDEVARSVVDHEFRRTAESPYMATMSYVYHAYGQESVKLFERNHSLIRIESFSEEDWEGLVTHVGKADWSTVRQVFDSFLFRSITNDKSWEKFTKTFDTAGSHQ